MFVLLLHLTCTFINKGPELLESTDKNANPPSESPRLCALGQIPFSKLISSLVEMTLAIMPTSGLF